MTYTALTRPDVVDRDFLDAYIDNDLDIACRAGAIGARSLAVGAADCERPLPMPRGAVVMGNGASVPEAQWTTTDPSILTSAGWRPLAAYQQRIDAALWRRL